VRPSSDFRAVETWVHLGFLSISRSALADHIPSPLRCLALVTSGLAKSAHAPPAGPVAALILPPRSTEPPCLVSLCCQFFSVCSRSIVPLSDSSPLVRFLFGSENHAITQQV
jgi:hypothetical protein